jgi:hypothetical protein
VAQLLVMPPDMPRSSLDFMNQLMSHVSMVTFDEVLATALYPFLTQFPDRITEIGAHIGQVFGVPS